MPLNTEGREWLRKLKFFQKKYLAKKFYLKAWIRVSNIGESISVIMESDLTKFTKTRFLSFSSDCIADKNMQEPVLDWLSVKKSCAIIMGLFLLPERPDQVPFFLCIFPF